MSSKRSHILKQTRMDGMDVVDIMDQETTTYKVHRKSKYRIYLIVRIYLLVLLIS